MTEDGERRAFFAAVKVDRFHTLRASIGFRLANQLMTTICERIRTALPDCEIGRIGRTSFEFLFTAASAEDARNWLMALVKEAGRQVEADDLFFDLTLTFGVADTRGRRVTSECMDSAESALAEAQRGHLPLIVAEWHEEAPADQRLTLMRDMQRAVRSGEFALFYQPKLRSRTGEIDSVEALLRWHHPSGTAVSPDVFIALAEDIGTIRPLTEWVINRAITDGDRLRQAGCAVKIDVNISAVLLPDPDFAAWAVSRLKDRGGAIGFEITETAMISNPDQAFANLQAFAAAGIRLAIDDYGSGYSSLAYLQRLPVEELKIDKSFVCAIASTNRDPLLVRSTIDLAHALGMEVTAEGVETPEAMALLRVMGCDLLQGYLISRPLPFEDLTRFILDKGQRSGLATLNSIGRKIRQRRPT